jgi:hypothetical protein
MGKLRAIIDFIEDFAYGLYISFRNPHNVDENREGKDNEESSA